MTLSEFCIRRPVFTILLMAALLVGGIAGYSSLSVGALPRVDFPTIQVSATLPGASPDMMASSVATPLEKQFSTISGISSMTSANTQGNTQITLQFDLNRNIDGAALDVQTAISSVIGSLPKEMTAPPSFKKVNPADQPVMFISVASDTLTLTDVDRYVETIMSQKIATLDGVAEVTIYGQQKYAVRVQADPEKLAANGLAFSDISNIVANSASNTPVGVIDGPKQIFNIQIAGQPQNAAGFGEIVATTNNGAVLRLKDVATIIDDVENNQSFAYLNGKRTVVMAVLKQPDANTIDVTKALHELIPTFASQLPASITITPLFDQSIAIKQSISDVQRTLLITVTIVIAVIYLFLFNARSTFIPALAVPLSIITTYGGMAMFGFSINNISLIALTMCVGFVVDDAIVMLENIIRHIENGEKPYDAAIKGAKEVGFTIISITFSLIAVFIPVLFMSGIIGRVFNEFAVTISFAILVSGFVSLTLTPMLCSKILKEHRANEKQNKMIAKSSALLELALEKYKSLLSWCLLHRRLVLAFTISTLIVTLVLFYIAPKGFFPMEDTGRIFGQTEAAQDISISSMLEKQLEVAAIIQKNPAVDQLFYAIGLGLNSTNTGRVYMTLKPKNERHSIFEVINELRRDTAKVVGVNLFLQPSQNIQIGSRPAKSLYQYTLQGTDINQLDDYSSRIMQALIKEPGFQDVTTDLQLKSMQLMLEINQEKAASLGISYASIKQALYDAFGTEQVATLYTPADNYEVIMEALPELQQFPEDVSKLYVKSASGNLVKLDSVATLTRSIGPFSINHQGQLPAVTISFNLTQDKALSQAVSAIKAAEKKIMLPNNIVSSFQGTTQAFQESEQGQGLLLILAIVVIYIILGMLYESFIHPITILSGLPTACIGAIITLMLFGMPIDVIALIGIILLIGIVKKNAIMMIDFAIKARSDGKTPEEAIYQACILRFRPIMMTTMCAIFGSLPIAIGFGAGSEIRQPLGIAIIGGLLASQFLTLFITPVIYLYLERFNTTKRES
ncbi:MAG: efflux RND transporter permease subunit [Rickettsiales bacterium]